MYEWLAWMDLVNLGALTQKATTVPVSINAPQDYKGRTPDLSRSEIEEDEDEDLAKAGHPVVQQQQLLQIGWFVAG